MNVINDINVEILRNRGIMAKVHRLKKDEEGNYVKPYLRERDLNSGEYLYDHEFFKFTNWSLANIDEDEPTGFGGFDNYQTQLEDRPMKTVPKTIAHIFDKYEITNEGVRIPDVRFGATLLLDSQIHEYVIVCLNAMLIAQGVVSPELAAEAISEQLKVLREGKVETEKEMRAKLLEISNDAASKTATGTTPTDQSKSPQSSVSTPDGVSSDVLTTSSGD